MVDITKYLNLIQREEKKEVRVYPEAMNSLYNLLMWHLGHKTRGEEYQPSESCYKVQNENTAKMAELMRLRKLQ